MSEDAYHRHAVRFADQYERLNPADLNRPWSDLLPPPPSDVLDVGAGSGRDAAWLADLGHRVTAVEPAAGLRREAQRRHTGSAIHWIDDRLPSLETVQKEETAFTLILLSAIWMHIPPEERPLSLETLARLTRPDGFLVIILRYGPSPDERIMYPVSPEELDRLGLPLDLYMIRNVAPNPDQLRRADVSWGTVVLKKASRGTA